MQYSSGDTVCLQSKLSPVFYYVTNQDKPETNTFKVFLDDDWYDLARSHIQGLYFEVLGTYPIGDLKYCHLRTDVSDTYLLVDQDNLIPYSHDLSVNAYYRALNQLMITHGVVKFPDKIEPYNPWYFTNDEFLINIGE